MLQNDSHNCYCGKSREKTIGENKSDKKQMAISIVGYKLEIRNWKNFGRRKKNFTR
jgi:hypothetical protein